MTEQVSERGVQLPCLIRSKEAPDGARVSHAHAENVTLLTTKALDDAVKSYLQSGDLQDLIDVNELSLRLAELRGVGRTGFEAMRHDALIRRGGYGDGLVQHPLAFDGEAG